MSKRVALFSTTGSDMLSSPLINSAEYLGAQGYLVDVFGVESTQFAAPTFLSPNITYIPYRVTETQIPGTKLLFALYRLNRLVGRKSYEFLIGFDPPGLINAAVLGKWRRTTYVYHSLEICSEATLVDWREKFFKRIERWLNRGAILTITQDDQRADILARENRLDRGRIAVVYNSSFGDPLPEKSRWMRERFDIPSAKRVVLCVGLLSGVHMADLIAESVGSWPETFVLVLHGWFSVHRPDIEEKIRRIAAQHPDKVFISDTVLPPAEKYRAFQSVDIGLVFYKPINDNLRYVGAASGKLFDFMRCGVPIIALDLPGMKELVEDSGAGVLVPAAMEIPGALTSILSDYEHYSESSLAAFGQYSFAQSYEAALTRILR